MYHVAVSADRGLLWRKGIAVDTKTVSPGAGEQALLARVRYEQGGDAIGSLGPKRRLEDAGMSISEKDSIAVLGRPAWVEGEPIRVARSVHASGRVTHAGASMRGLYAVVNLQEQTRSLRDGSAPAGDETPRQNRERRGIKGHGPGFGRAHPAHRTQRGSDCNQNHGAARDRSFPGDAT